MRNLLLPMRFPSFAPLARFVALLLSLGIFACGGSNDQGDTQSGSPPDGTVGDTNQSDEEVTDEDGSVEGSADSAGEETSEGGSDTSEPQDATSEPPPAGFVFEGHVAGRGLFHMSAAGQHMLAVGEGGAIFRFNGRAWVPEIGPTQATLYGVWLHESGLAIAVGAGGTLLRHQGFGWEALESGTDADLYAVHARDIDEIYITGDVGIILRGSGNTWVQENSNWPGPLRAVWVDAQGTAFAATAQSQVLRRGNSGWVASQATGSGVALMGLGGLGADVIAVGTKGTIARWNGKVWSVQVSNDTEGRDLHAVWVFPDERAVAVGDAGSIVEWDGSKWTVAEGVGPLNGRADLRAVAATWEPALPSGEFQPYQIAAGEKGRAVSGRRDAISPWMDAEVKLSVDLRDVWVASDSRLAVGEGGVALSRTPAGWTGELTHTTSDLNGLWRQSNRWYAVGASGTVLQREGGIWTSVEAPTIDDLYGVCALGEAVFAVGAKGRVFRRLSQSWIMEDSGVVEHLRDVWPLADGRLVAVGDGGVVVIRSNEGVWSQIRVPVSSALRRVWGVANFGSEMVYVSGDHGALLIGPPGDLKLVNTSPLDFLYGLWAPSPDELVVVGWGGLVWRIAGVSPSGWSDFDAVYMGGSPVFQSVMGLSAADWLAVGRGGTLLRYSAPVR